MNKTIIIFGATGGIGEAIARHLAKEGYNLVIHYANNFAKAERLLEELSTYQIKTIVAKANIANEKDVQNLFDLAEKQLGPIYGVINTSGIMRLSPIATLDLEQFDQLIQTNLRGAFVVAKTAANRLIEGGSLINFSTSVTKTQLPTYGAYAASKSAVETLTLILARELRGKGIRVNGIAPGPTATPLFLDGKTPEQIQQLSLAAPLERLGTPADIATATAALLGENSWINGQVIYVNGGLI